MCYMAARPAQVGVRELRQNLSVYLDRVKKGQTLAVTEHGHVIAELRPRSGRADRVAQLVADGQVVPARRPPSKLPPPLKLQLDRPVSALLDGLRDDSI
jgi:prevent-host-death family protein